MTSRSKQVILEHRPATRLLYPADLAVNTVSLSFIRTMEEQRLLSEKENEVSPPLPPVYSELEPETHPKSSSAALPLPTYDQSEKYEKEGILVEPTAAQSVSITSHPSTRWTQNSGTWCEFTLFFFVCATFSVLGFILAFCVATTTAAQSGAIAGLGTAFVFKPLVYEFYYKSYEKEWSQNWCASYKESTGLENCLHWTSTSMRILFFIIGLFGLVLIYKGFSTFFKSRGSEN